MIRKILVAFLLITSTNLIAQRTSSSPYSFFGVGEEFSARTVEQNSMGGIGVAFSHYKYLNFTNPAAYSDLRFTTYAFGMSHSELKVKDALEEQTGASSSLNYVALAFPLGKKAGFSLGLQPISSVGYSLSNTLLEDGEASEITLFSGDGGVSRLYGSFGIKIAKGFSLGIEADFNFGTVDNSITNQKRNVSLATKYKQESYIRGGSVSIGAQYKKELKNKLLLTAGAVYKLGNDLKVTGNSHTYSLTFSNTGSEIIRDTLANANGQKVFSINGNYRLPTKATLGIGVGKFDKWYAGVEYETQDAIEVSGALNNVNNVYQYGNSNRFSLGGFVIPKINSISSYWNRVTYRAGFRFEKTGLLLDGTGLGVDFTSIDDFGISFGLGLPLGNRYSNLNMGFEYGQKGTTSNNLLQENYFNFRLSLSLTDINWFIKRKID
jgi:hypothetical protein